MGCISNCERSSTCARAHEPSDSSVDWGNCGFGYMNSQSHSVAMYCGPSCHYQMYIPLASAHPCKGCRCDCSGIDGSRCDMVNGICRNKECE